MSLEGKANRLATMIRGNLGLAMQGLAVVPLFAGYDLDERRRPDLLLRRDRRLLRGARPPQRRVGLAVRPRVDEEAAGARAWTPTAPCGSRSRRSTTPPTTTRPPAARTSAAGSGRRVGRRRRRGAAVRPRRRSSPRVVEQVVADRRGNPGRCADEHAVLRLARAADEGPGRLRPQGNRPRPVGRRAGLRQAASRSSPRTPRGPCTRSPRSTTGSPSPRSASTTSSRTSGSPASATPTCAATPTTAPTSPPAAWPTPTPRPSARSSPRSPSPTRSRSSWPRSARTPTSDQIYRLTYDGSVADEQGFVAMGGASEPISERAAGALAPRA